MTSKQYALWLFAAWFNVGLWAILISLRDYTSCVCLSTHLLSQWSLFKINPQMKLISTASRLKTLLIYQTDIETSGIFLHNSKLISTASRLNTLLIYQTDLETAGIFYTSCVCHSTHLLSQWSLFKINPQMKLILAASRLNTLLCYD